MARVNAEVVIDGRYHPSIWLGLRELWTFREVVWAFAERHVRLKYKQAVLGVAWAVVQPLAFMFIFVLVFGRLGGISSGGFPYAGVTLAALVSWFFLQNAVSFGAQALIMDSALVRKVHFPREAPILGAVVSACLDFAIGMAVLLALGPTFGLRFSWTALLAIPLWLVLAVLAFGVATGLGALNVYYRDFRFALPVLLQLWLFATPVAYPLSAIPQEWRNFYVVINPAAVIIDGIRQTLSQGQVPALPLLTIGVTAAVTVASLGYWIFKRLEPGFADAI